MSTELWMILHAPLALPYAERLAIAKRGEHFAWFALAVEITRRGKLLLVPNVTVAEATNVVVHGMQRVFSSSWVHGGYNSFVQEGPAWKILPPSLQFAAL